MKQLWRWFCDRRRLANAKRAIDAMNRFDYKRARRFIARAGEWERAGK